MGSCLSDQQRSALAGLATDVMVDIRGKRRELVAVQIAKSDPAGWFVGGRCLAEGKRPSAYLEAKITQGTHTPEQKPQAVQALNQMLKDVLGDMAEASYVTLHEIAADAWGYDGHTQASRVPAKRMTGRCRHLGAGQSGTLGQAGEGTDGLGDQHGSVAATDAVGGDYHVYWPQTLARPPSLE